MIEFAFEAMIAMVLLAVGVVFFGLAVTGLASVWRANFPKGPKE